jgi:2-haloacid dehalogenase
MTIRAFVFDLFKTLVDIQSIDKIFFQLNIGVDDVKQLIESWHVKQLQYAWLLTLMGRFETFTDISIRALRYTARSYGIELSQEQIAKIVEARLHLELFPDSKKGIEDLRTKKKEIYLLVLSNGERNYLNTQLGNVGLLSSLDFIISAEEVCSYKPSPQVYGLASKRLNIPLSELALVSSNLWDIAGAKAAGMQTCWINRESSLFIMEEIDLNPDYILSSMKDLNQI